MLGGEDPQFSGRFHVHATTVLRAEAAQAWRWRSANHGSIWDSRSGAALWLCWVVRGSIWCPV